MPKDKLVPLQLKNSGKRESPIKNTAVPLRNESIPDINFQRSRSARPTRKTLIKKKPRHNEGSDT